MGVRTQVQAAGGWRLAATLDLDTIRTAAALERLAPEWAALWSRAEARLPFNHPGWLLAWWGTLGGGALRVFTARADGRLVGLLPMFIYPDGGLSRLLPLGISVSDAFDILAEPGWSRQVAVALAHRIAADPDGWDQCEWHEVPVGSVLRDVAAVATLQSMSPVLDVDRFAALPARSGPQRRLARARRAAVRAGLALDQSDLGAMEALFALHGAQWQARGEPGVLDAAPVQRFHRQAAQALARTDTLRLQRLRDGTRTVAVLYGFQARGRAYAYLSGIDPAYGQLGLGTVLIGAAIDRARADGARELDFLRGTEPYKYAWGAVDRPQLRLAVSADQPRQDRLRVLPGGSGGAPVPSHAG